MKHAIQKYHKVASTTLELMIAPDPVLRYPDPSRPRGLLRHHGAIIHRAGFGYFEARGWGKGGERWNGRFGRRWSGECLLSLATRELTAKPK